MIQLIQTLSIIWILLEQLKVHLQIITLALQLVLQPLQADMKKKKRFHHHNKINHQLQWIRICKTWRWTTQCFSNLECKTWCSRWCKTRTLWITLCRWCKEWTWEPCKAWWTEEIWVWKGWCLIQTCYRTYRKCWLIQKIKQWLIKWKQLILEWTLTWCWRVCLILARFRELILIQELLSLVFMENL